MRSYRYLHFDVFTDRLFGGNQLAVVLDARGLDSATCQAIAKEMNFSETTFLLPAERSDTDIRMRIFTPGEELPIAGHPTVGTTFALARAGIIAAGRERFVFGLNAGPTPVALTWRHDELSFVWMTQPLPTFSEPIADPARAASALTLSAAAVAGTGHPVQVVSCGVPFLFVPLATRSAVDTAVANASVLADLLAATRSGAHGVFLFSTERGADRATVYSRMFAPALGVAEDPATGVASGPLGCYLVRHKIVPPEKADSILSLQGAKMGRPSHVHVAIGVESDAIVSVRVGGESVLAGEGILYV
jgi:trans-2,3-dihydro-3-hydroxyanthranilate isomerase